MEGSRPNILIGVTGSVASIKLPLLCSSLCCIGNVRVVTTQHAQHFWKPSDLPVSVEVFRDADEWSTWNKMGDDVLHIELRRWANVFVVAPLDANTLSKMSHGACDNLLTCVARCWDPSAAPLLVCPAMNTLMYTHPATQEQLQTLQKWGIRVVPVVSKRLACGDVGDGAMAHVETIVDEVKKALKKE